MKRNLGLCCALLSALMLLGASACLDPGATLGPDPAPTQCVSDEECAETLVCHERGACTVDVAQGETKQVSFLFSPTPDSGLLAQRSDVVAASPHQGLDFSLQASTSVLGSVRRGDGKAVLAGTLIFTPSNDLSGALRQQTSLNQDIQGANTYGYSVQLVPGLYDITFVSGQPEIPNRRWRAQPIGESPTELELTLPPASQITTIEGTLTHQDPALDPSSVSNRIPVEGVRVVAVAADGTTSTASVTDAAGNFSILAWADNGVHDLIIGPASPNALVPQILRREAFDASQGQVQALAFDLGRWSTQRVELRLRVLEEMIVEGMKKDQDDLDALDFSLSDARLLLVGTLPDGQQITLHYALGSGEPITLLAIPYTVSFIPPPTSRFGALSFEWDASLSGAPFLSEGLEFKPRQQVTITVADAFGEPVPSARVSLRPRSGLEKRGSGAELPIYENEARELAARTDAEGRFTTYLEPQWTYEFEVVPGPQSGAPAGTFTFVPERDATEDDALRFELARPLVLFGSVSDFDSQSFQPVSGLTFTLYDYSDQAAPHIVAHGRTDEQGQFRAIIPAD